MKQLKIKFAGPESTEELCAWLTSTEGNLFDKDIIGYPTLRVLASYNGEGPVAYLPTQLATVLESLAVKPGLEPMQAAQAFKDLVKGAELNSSSLGVKEMYFLCQDENVVKVAQNHGFEEIKCTVLRMKL